MWRYPPTDLERGRALKELVAVSYHRLDAYGFHAMEMVQCLVERRGEGEVGVASVECLTGEDVWKAGEQSVYDPKLLNEALSRLKARPLPEGSDLQKLVEHPVLFVINYRDGLRASVLTLNGAVAEWTAAWRYDDGQTDSTLFWTQEERPFHQFAHLLKGIEQMMHTGKPTWPAERTLLASGTLDALLNSRKQHRPLPTPYLDVAYSTDWNWQQPPPPPAGRPINNQ